MIFIFAPYATALDLTCLDLQMEMPAEFHAAIIFLIFHTYEVFSIFLSVASELTHVCYLLPCMGPVLLEFVTIYFVWTREILQAWSRLQAAGWIEYINLPPTNNRYIVASEHRSTGCDQIYPYASTALNDADVYATRQLCANALRINLIDVDLAVSNGTIIADPRNRKWHLIECSHEEATEIIAGVYAENKRNDD